MSKTSEELILCQRLTKELMKIDPEFPLKWAVCFYEIALNEGITGAHLVRLTGFPHSSISVIINGLSVKGRYAKGSYDLIALRQSQEDKRKYHLHLTPKGRLLVEGLSEIVSSFH